MTQRKIALPYGIAGVALGQPLSDGAAVAVALISSQLSISSAKLPTALPLFATGLGALGLLGWRRKRTANAA